MKLLCIGFDGLDYADWTEFAHLWPAVVLESPKPLSGPAWTSIYTGLSADTHGVTDMWGRPMNGAKCHADIEPQCVWNHMPGVSKVLCNLPISWPPSEDKDIKAFVSGFPRAKPFATPAGVIEESYMEEWGDLIDWTSKDLAWCGELTERGLLASQNETVYRAYGCTSWFIPTAQSVDLGWIVYTFPDRLMHAFSTIEGVRNWIGGFAKKLCLKLDAELQPENILVMSDHGFKPGLHTTTGVLAAKGVKLPERAQTSDVAGLILDVFGFEHAPAEHDDYNDEEWQAMRSKLAELGYVA